MSIVRPHPVPLDGLPAAVTVYEVGPRDGLQNEPDRVPVQTKAKLIRRLIAAGLPAVELTSFVPAAWVPQLGDAEELLDLLAGELTGLRAPVLVTNVKGLDRAVASGAREVAVPASATEAFAQRNLNRTLDASLAMLGDVVTRARDAGLAVRGYVSMCFVDPWEGPVDPGQVTRVVERLLELGCGEISLGDTTGAATAGQVRALLDRLYRRGIPAGQLAVHFHDTYGQALANTLAALQCGVATVDASVGGFGGCPYAESATGNLATDDLAWQLEGLGIATGIDLQRLTETSHWLAGQLGRQPPSAVARAMRSSGAPAEELAD